MHGCERKADERERCTALGVLVMASNVASVSSSEMILSSRKNTHVCCHQQIGSNLAPFCPDRENSSPFVLNLLEERSFSGRCYKTQTPVTNVLKWLRCSGSSGRTTWVPCPQPSQACANGSVTADWGSGVHGATPASFTQIDTVQVPRGSRSVGFR